MVYASLLQLQQTSKLATVRFFGKVLGTGADYYVAEATYAEPPEPPEEPPPPPPGAPVEETGTGTHPLPHSNTLSRPLCSCGLGLSLTGRSHRLSPCRLQRVRVLRDDRLVGRVDSTA